MFDNLRDDAASMYEEDEIKENMQGSALAPGLKVPEKLILGMTSFQIFILTVLLMLAVCMIGGMLLLITGKFGI